MGQKGFIRQALSHLAGSQAKKSIKATPKKLQEVRRPVMQLRTKI